MFSGADGANPGDLLFILGVGKGGLLGDSIERVMGRASGATVQVPEYSADEAADDAGPGIVLKRKRMDCYEELWKN